MSDRAGVYLGGKRTLVLNQGFIMSGGPTGQGSARMRLFGSKCRNKGKVIFPLGIQGRKKEILTDIVNLQTYKKGFPSIEHILLVVVFRPGLRGPLVVREGSAGGAEELFL